VYLDYKQAEEGEERGGRLPRASADGRQAAEGKNTKAQEPQEASLLAANPPPIPAKTQSSKKISYKEKREFEQLAVQIPAMEAEKEQIEKTLYKNPPSSFTQVQTLSARLAELNHAIDTATDRWLELSEMES
jgi:ATP-binding cassette subfamily F protein uup